MFFDISTLHIRPFEGFSPLKLEIFQKLGTRNLEVFIIPTEFFKVQSDFFRLPTFRLPTFRLSDFPTFFKKSVPT